MADNKTKPGFARGVTTLMDNFANPNMPYNIGTRLAGAALSKIESTVLGNMGSVGRAIQWKARGDTKAFKRVIGGRILSATLGNMGNIGAAISAGIAKSTDMVDDNPAIEEINQIKRKARGEPVTNDQLFLGLEETAKNIDKRFGYIVQGFEEIAEGAEELDKRFNKMEEVTKKNLLMVSESTLEQVKQMNQPIISKLDNVETSIRKIAGAVSEHESKLHAISSNMQFLGKSMAQNQLKAGKSDESDIFKGLSASEKSKLKSFLKLATMRKGAVGASGVASRIGKTAMGLGRFAGVAGKTAVAAGGIGALLTILGKTVADGVTGLKDEYQKRPGGALDMRPETPEQRQKRLPNVPWDKWQKSDKKLNRQYSPDQKIDGQQPKKIQTPETTKQDKLLESLGVPLSAREYLLPKHHGKPQHHQKQEDVQKSLKWYDKKPSERFKDGPVRLKMPDGSVRNLDPKNPKDRKILEKGKEGLRGELDPSAMMQNMKTAGFSGKVVHGPFKDPRLKPEAKMGRVGHSTMFGAGIPLAIEGGPYIGGGGRSSGPGRMGGLGSGGYSGISDGGGWGIPPSGYANRVGGDGDPAGRGGAGNRRRRTGRSGGGPPRSATSDMGRAGGSGASNTPTGNTRGALNPDGKNPLSLQRSGLGGANLTRAQKEHFYALSMAEMGPNRPGKAYSMLMESAYNRGFQEKDTHISENLKEGYYEPLRSGKGKYNRTRGWSNYLKYKKQLRENPELFEKLDKAHNEVLGGSNYTDLATQNASANVAASARRDQTITREAYGETFSRKDLMKGAGKHGLGTVQSTQKYVQNTKKQLESYYSNIDERKATADLGKSPLAGLRGAQSGLSADPAAKSPRTRGLSSPPVAAPGAALAGQPKQSKNPNYVYPMMTGTMAVHGKGGWHGRTAEFGHARGRLHAGVDLYAVDPKTGKLQVGASAPVYATSNGKITKIAKHRGGTRQGQKSGAGHYIEYQDKHGVKHRYLHTDIRTFNNPRTGKPWKVNDKIVQGDHLTNITGSGTAFGRKASQLGSYNAAVNYFEKRGWGSTNMPHLHYETSYKGRKFDPDKLFPEFHGGRGVNANKKKMFGFTQKDLDAIGASMSDSKGLPPGTEKFAFAGSTGLGPSPAAEGLDASKAQKPGEVKPSASTSRAPSSGIAGLAKAAQGAVIPPSNKGKSSVSQSMPTHVKTSDKSEGTVGPAKPKTITPLGAKEIKAKTGTVIPAQKPSKTIQSKTVSESAIPAKKKKLTSITDYAGHGPKGAPPASALPKKAKAAPAPAKKATSTASRLGVSSAKLAANKKKEEKTVASRLGVSKKKLDANALKRDAVSSSRLGVPASKLAKNKGLPKSGDGSVGKDENYTGGGSQQPDGQKSRYQGGAEQADPGGFNPETSEPSPGDNGYGSYMNCFI